MKTVISGFFPQILPKNYSFNIVPNNSPEQNLHGLSNDEEIVLQAIVNLNREHDLFLATAQVTPVSPRNLEPEAPEAPEAPELTLDGGGIAAAALAEQVLAVVERFQSGG